MKVVNFKQAKSVAKRPALTSGVTREANHEDIPELGKIDHVLGMTVFSNSSLACHSDSGLVAYPAGSVLILLDCLRNRQDSTIHTPRKMITAVCFSPDGKLVATGESGHQPSVRVWRLSTMSEIASLEGHHVGISCVSFTRQMSAIVVVGDAFDMVISVWSWPQAVMLSLNKFADKVCAMDISSEGDFFVTVGNRHVKFYCMELLYSPTFLISQDVPVPLPTRCGTLDSLKDNYFCDVACGLDSCADFIYVISSSGILCQMNKDRMLERWVNVNVSMATCLARDETHLFVGCDGGMVRMFQASDLKIVITLPRPHRLGLDIAQITEFSDPVPKSGGDCRKEPDPEYPLVRAMAYDHCSHQLTVIYDDSSIYIWRRRSCNGVYTFQKCYSSLYHFGCIWDLTLYPLSEGSRGGALPPGALITVSADGTLRAWDVASIISKQSMLKRNAVSTNCLKIVYSKTDKEAGKEKARQMKRLRCEAMSPAFQRESREAFGVVAVCPEGAHIATGNRHGRVMVYDAHSMKLLATRFAHDIEVTALSYATTHLYKILASGSRDRMIHLMDASSDYHLLSTLDDHSSSITAIHFTYISQCLLMVSSSLDMSILVRAYLDNTPLSFNHVRAIVEKKAVMDFTMHPWSGQIALVCQDKLVRIYSLLNSQKSSNSYRGSPARGGSLIKISMDPSGQYVLTACTNKTINLIEFNTGEILHTFSGHAETITRIRFSHNLKHVISSASDGCIFMWQLPQTVAYSVKKVMAEMGLLTRGMVLNNRWKKTCGHKVNQPQSNSPKPEPEPEPVAETATLEAQSPITTRNDEKENTQQQQPDEADHLTFNRLLSLSSAAAVTLNEDGTLVESTRSPEASVVKTVEHQADDREIQSDAFAVKQATANVHPLGKASKRLHPLNLKKGPHNAEWLQTCTQRRQLFKVEAKSIKRILSMMKLVADAMEKDLQDITAPPVGLVSHDICRWQQDAAPERCDDSSPLAVDAKSHPSRTPTRTPEVPLGPNKSLSMMTTSLPRRNPHRTSVEKRTRLPSPQSRGCLEFSESEGSLCPNFGKQSTADDVGLTGHGKMDNRPFKTKGRGTDTVSSRNANHLEQGQEEELCAAVLDLKRTSDTNTLSPQPSAASVAQSAEDGYTSSLDALDDQTNEGNRKARPASKRFGHGLCLSNKKYDRRKKLKRAGRSTAKVEGLTSPSQSASRLHVKVPSRNPGSVGHKLNEVSQSAPTGRPPRIEAAGTTCLGWESPRQDKYVGVKPGSAASSIFAPSSSCQLSREFPERESSSKAHSAHECHRVATNATQWALADANSDIREKKNILSAKEERCGNVSLNRKYATTCKGKAGSLNRTTSLML